MSQQELNNLPFFINFDKSLDKMEGNESPFLKSVGWDVNRNPDSSIGTNNPTLEGQNQLVLTPTRSNVPLDSNLLPAGINIHVGSYYSPTTQELFYCNHNSNQNHGIYVIRGNEGTQFRVIEDQWLEFSDDPEAFIADHRVTLRLVLDANKNVIEEYLILTNGNAWQKMISVYAAIATNGFNVAQFPYYTLKPPHFVRKELLDFIPYAPMIKPLVRTLPNDPANANDLNDLLDKSIQFAYSFNNTDGRPTPFSPWSLPLIVKSEDYLNSSLVLPKRAELTLYAGSPLTESIDIYIKQCGGDWLKYTRIYKFTECGDNDQRVIGTQYWLRKNPWDIYQYDTTFNTIKFIFDFSRVAEIFSQTEALRLQNDMPQLSQAMVDLGESVGLGYNRYNYNNFGCDVLDNMDLSVKEKSTVTCPAPLRKIKMYAYIGEARDTFAYISQIGYFNGLDTRMRFGGVYINEDQSTVTISVDISETFDLTFADKSAFCLYLKGTPYYAVGKWYVVNADNSLTKIDDLLDGSLTSTNNFIKSVFTAGGYFVCLFELTVPAGRYNATLGRHNVSLSGDFRNTSTYIMGIANSRVKSSFGNNTVIKPANSIVSFSKEMEIDCTNGDVDTWGNGQDLFYVYCPSTTQQGNLRFRFIEGYLKESRNDPFPVELFPYDMTRNAQDDGGVFTDKNGFYFAATKVQASNVINIQFTAKINCTYPTVFEIPTSQSGSGWRQNNTAYLSDYNNNVVGDCNRIIYSGKLTDLTGVIGYSNIGISIVDGSTVYTQQDGTFELIVHNGQNNLRQSNVYVNAGGSFLITIENCGQIPLFNFSENNVLCINCQKRVYPIPLNLSIVIQSQGQTSLKEGGKYSIGVYGADYAGRIMFVNPLKELTVPTFVQRQDIFATYFEWALSNTLDFSQYPDIKWVTAAVTKVLNIKTYLSWVGDKIQYIDGNGQVISDASNAVFCAIYIDSLYNYNVQNNFSTLATYQFAQGDRIQVLDDGDGNLLSSAIDVQILGTNYNQVAINAGLLPPLQNTVATTPSQTGLNSSVTLLIRYDRRLDALIDKTGFWIQAYTPMQQTEEIPFCEQGFLPVINNKPAIFTGYNNGSATYSYPSTVDLDFFDTYFLTRNINIPNVGDKAFGHPFESPNISDSWGASCTSCGRQNVKNDNARQYWDKPDIIQGDAYGEILNGVATFRSSNRKNFGQHPYGGIVAMKAQRSIVIVICENDFFVTNYNFQFIYANAQGVQVANLDDKLSVPHQKIGSNFGLALQNTRAIIFHDKWVSWYDYKNEAWVMCNYSEAKDISKDGADSYLIAKTKFINDWNVSVPKERRFDVSMGIDIERNNLYLTFRPRRSNNQQGRSFVNKNRNLRLDHQETLTFNLDTQKFVRMEGFTPEGYGILKGQATGKQMVAFAAGQPYLHNTSTNSFLNYFGETVEPVIAVVINQAPDLKKILQNVALDATMRWFVDMIYDTQNNSFSYIPLNYFKEREKFFNSEVLRDMVSYINTAPEDRFRSTLIEGKRLFGVYFYVRLVGDPNFPNDYRELRKIYSLVTQSQPNKK